MITHQTNCPICDFQLRERENNICPRCKTDLSLWNQSIDLPTAYYNQALQMLRANRLGDAEEKLIAALTLYPENIDAQILLGKIYAEQERYDEAIAVWEKVLNYRSPNSHEIEELINQAKKCRDEMSLEREGKQKELLRNAKAEEARKVRLRWIGYSTFVFVAALMLGWFFPISKLFKEAPTSLQTGTIIKVPDYTSKVEEILKSHGKSEIKVHQKDSIIYLLGEVFIPQEKYEIESIFQQQDIEGVTAIDLSGITVKHPKGYYYTVREGDNLWLIAENALGNGEMFERIYQVNKQTIENPSKIAKGISIIIPE